MTIEANAIDRILEWSSSIHHWQAHALRQLVAQKKPDIKELVDLCKKDEEDGQQSRVPDSHPSNRDQGKMCLCEVCEIEHVNALAPEKNMEFKCKGLTVIYGENGSGKSGYARILKKACCARGQDSQQIMPNVFDSEHGTPIATIKYKVGNNDRSWTLGKDDDTTISAIQVFDAHTANVHLDNKGNALVYTPFPVRCLEELASLCDEVKKELLEEIKQIEEQTPKAISEPACGKETSVGKLMAKPDADTAPERAKALAELTQAEETRLIKLEADQADDPTHLAAKLRHSKKELDDYEKILDELFASISEDNSNKLRRLANEKDTTFKAAEAASSEQFRNEPLPQIGSKVWKRLWDSARAFSEEEAYPKAPFPDANNVCVLCQQTLTKAASDRLRRFDDFVRGDTEKRANVARTTYDNELKKFKDAAMLCAALRKIRKTMKNCQNDLKKIQKTTVLALLRYRQIRQYHTSPSAASYHYRPIPEYPCQALRDLATDLENRVKAAEVESPTRVKLSDEKEELKARRWLKSSLDDVLAEIERRQKIKRLEEVMKRTETKSITNKSKEISKALVTEKFCEKFRDEMGKFKLDSLPVELQHSGSKGSSSLKESNPLLCRRS